jgi:hypothetical protein
MVDLHEIEALKRLKYRYCRCLDEKRWAELEDCLTEDATSAYGGGRYSFTGRAAILEFLRDALGGAHRITTHRVHQPEIELTGPTTATGIWALDDVLIDTVANTTLRGAAFYHDTYTKAGGAWRIRSTGYTRVFEERESRGDVRGLRLTVTPGTPG